jgi:hypothetical protein
MTGSGDEVCVPGNGHFITESVWEGKRNLAQFMGRARF